MVMFEKKESAFSSKNTQSCETDRERFRIEDVHPIAIPKTVPLERTPPRSILNVYSGRFTRFDYKTLFYDAFMSPNDKYIRLSGPPLANLSRHVESAILQVDGRDVTRKVRLKDILRRQDSRIAENSGQILTFISPHFSSEVTISKSDVGTFNGKNVLLTYSKNNSLVWISDWASFYVKAHGVNSILLYDTGSTAYTRQELLEALRSIRGIDTAVIVHWPFLHGPFCERRGVNSFANYSQVAMLNHAKEKYLSRARSVINCDVDELIYSRNGESICDAAAEGWRGIVLVPGTWIESVTTARAAPYRHLDFRHTDPKRGAPRLKWAISPSKLPSRQNWRVHGVDTGWLGIALDAVTTKSRFHLAHFRGISTNWREKRAVYKPPSEHHVAFADIERFILPFFS